MKKLSLLLALIIVASLFVGCKGNGGKTGFEYSYNPPSSIITVEQYRQKIDELCAYDSYSVADADYLKKLDGITNDLKNLIVYSQDSVEYSGTAYYVSTSGNDDNDGKTPQTAWATIGRVNTQEFSNGDAVLFERGGLFRGQLRSKSGVTYAAYGEGAKPKLFNSYDGTDGKWVETDYPNVWKFDKKLMCEDVGIVVFNDGEYFTQPTEQIITIGELKENFTFVYNSVYNSKRGIDNCLYLYYDGGNPGEKFQSIEIGGYKSTIVLSKGAKDILIDNLDLRFGGNITWGTDVSNIVMRNCVAAWQGGTRDGLLKEPRLGGGAGAWHACDTMIFEQCYFYQQFDSGVSPQYHIYRDNGDSPCLFNKFITRNCLFEKCEYTYELFMSQDGTDEELFKDMYFGYNICREGGLGFGTKVAESAYVKMWQSHENYSEGCVIEKNVFDRALGKTLDMASISEQGVLSLEKLPQMNNNVYIFPENNKIFAMINGVTYKSNRKGCSDYAALGLETNPVFMYVK